jgi:hypothetical protein
MKLFHRLKWVVIGAALCSVTAMAEPTANTVHPKSEWHWSLTASGLALMAGGGALAYFQNEAADRDMSVYRNSAFTENTLDYRERVRTHEKWTWVGLGCAAVGGVLFVVSF